MTKNRQSAANELSNEQVQVLLTGKFGDGSLIPNYRCPSANWGYSTNSIYKEYMQFKKELLGNLVTHDIETKVNQGFKANLIHSIRSIYCGAITEIAKESTEDSLHRMDDLGLAMWFFDDGSLHKTKEFYNLNTQAYSEDINRNLFVPFLWDNYRIIAKPTIERKKDGREFWYLRIGKFQGACVISEILSGYGLDCFHYKLVSSETILLRSKLQEKLKSEGVDIRMAHPNTIKGAIRRLHKI